MAYFDCFNGDADGICALTQLRLQDPRESTLITGVKRDIKLLDQVQAKADDAVTVLDVSMDKNREALDRVLAAGAQVFYVDHHFAGDIPDAPNLNATINTAADVCTSLLVNQHLKGAFLEWAVVGTFGDNLKKSATGMAKALNISSAELAKLEWLGIYLNYNGYGSHIDDLYFHPAELFKKTVAHQTATAFMQEDVTTFETLESGYHEDMNKAAALKPMFDQPHAAVYQLPDASWARRVSGVFGNELANKTPERAHAVITKKSDQGHVVSVRAPLNNKQGADVICRQFATGGGRAAAAGINDLPSTDIDAFVRVFSEYYLPGS